MSTKKDLIIIKIGGSILTNKNTSPFIINKKLIVKIAQNISKGFNSKKQNVIIVHGAGSAGHIIAKEHDLINGSKNIAKKNSATKQIQKNIIQLQSIITKAINNTGLKVCSVQSSDICLNARGTLSFFNNDVIEKLLKNNIIPVLSGTMVPDTEWKYSILSGDTIVTHIAKNFHTHTIALASDIDGVFTKDPYRNPDAKFIKTINLADILKNKKSYTLGGAHTTDVTGGLIGKLQALLPLIKHYKNETSPSIFIFNGSNSKHFSDIFHNTVERKTDICI